MVLVNDSCLDKYLRLCCRIGRAHPHICSGSSDVACGLDLFRL